MAQILLTTLSPLWPLLALAVAAALLGAVLRHPRTKGWLGERRVRRMIREGLDPHSYVDLHNVTLPTAEGSTQMDHVIFSPHGVFVLETKNLGGWIFGSERQPQWTQKLHKSHSQQFQNPLRQNYLHTQTLQALLQLPAEQVHSVVAFVGPSQFKTAMPAQVTQGDAFIGYILGFRQEIFSPEQMQGLIDRLEQVRLAPTRATEQAHVAHVQQRRAGKTRKAGKAQEPKGPTVAAAPAAPASVAPQPVAPVQPPPVSATVPGSAAPAVAKAEIPTGATVPTPASQPPVSAPAARPAKTCPQCAAALQRLRLQRGPLAGQVIYRCSNTAQCQYVRPLETSAAQ